MKDEIKEILDRLETLAKQGIIEVKECDDHIETLEYYKLDELRLNNFSAKVLYDYITKLQTIEKQYSAVLSENVELQQELELTQKTAIEYQKKYQEERELYFSEHEVKEDYKSRNDKALKYIEKYLLPRHSIKDTDWDFEEVIFSDLPVEAIKPLVDTLQGSDKE